MRIPVRRRGPALGFNLTAMIDVVFNLIVFFLVASHFSQAQSDVAVNLPKATQAATGDDDPQRLIITVTSTGEWRVANNVVSLPQIEAMIREAVAENPADFSIHIRGDRTARYEFIEPLLLASARNKVTTVRFNVVAP